MTVGRVSGKSVWSGTQIAEPKGVSVVFQATSQQISCHIAQNLTKISDTRKLHAHPNSKYFWND